MFHLLLHPTKTASRSCRNLWLPLAVLSCLFNFAKLTAAETVASQHLLLNLFIPFFLLLFHLLVFQSWSNSNMNIFAKKPTAKEAILLNMKEMKNDTRGIEMEITTLQLEERKLVVEIKRAIKTENEAATKILVCQLVRLRQQITNLLGSRAQLRRIATHTQVMRANNAVATGMQGAVKAMVAMNEQMAPADQAKIIQEFQRQSTQMDKIKEMLSHAIDDDLDDDEAEWESAYLINQILGEIGVDSDNS